MVSATNITFLGWTADQWNAISATVTALATVVTAVVAVLAALYARGQLQHARELRTEQARPFVVADIVLDPDHSHVFNLVVENVGPTVAKNVRLTFDPPITTTLDNQISLRESPLLTSGIPTMPPGKRIAVLFDISHARFEQGLPTTYRVLVDLEDYKGERQETLMYVADVNHLYNVGRVTTKGIHEAADALQDISKRMRGWSDGKHLAVTTYDGDYQRWSDEWQRRHGDGRPPSLGNLYPAGRPSPSPFGVLENRRRPLLGSRTPKFYRSSRRRR